MVSGVVGALEGFAVQFGLPGVFAISLLGSAVPFLPLPYLVVVVFLSGTQNPLLLGVVAGAGGAIGKLTSYFLGRFGYFASGRETRKGLDTLHDVIEKYGAVGVFVFAVTPLPDDVYIIPMGIARLPFWKFFMADLAGKIVLSVGIAYFGRAYLGSLDSLAGGSLVPVVLGILLTILVSVMVIRADWVLAVTTVQTRGFRGLAADLPVILRLKKKA